MKRILYLDAFAGVSGDMILGALIDLGIDLASLSGSLSTLNVGGWSLHKETVLRHGLSATQLKVRTDTSGLSSRTYADICRIIQDANLHPAVKKNSIQVFECLAAVEADIHRVALEDVHFHEVGAVDSIIDIVGIAWCLHEMKIDELYFSSLPVGRGWVECEHGQMPLPAPATAKLLSGLVVVSAPDNMEWVTPTGAAIVSTLGLQSLTFPCGRLTSIGVGAGTMDPACRPNLLRAFLYEPETEVDSVDLVETNLDDLTAEETGFLIERLWENNPLDVWITPVSMKKNRPGQVVSVLCESSSRASIIDCLYAYSTTFGIRYRPVARDTLSREIVHVSTSLGTVAVKLGYRDGVLIKKAPEYEDCARIAQANSLAVRTVYQMALEAIDG